jgi:hypothetical protein
VLSGVLEVVRLAARQRLWFKHDRNLAHTGANVWQSMNVTYPGIWIAYGGPSERPLVTRTASDRFMQVGAPEGAYNI